MEFPITKKGHVHIHEYEKQDLDLAYRFAKVIHKEAENLIKAVVLFGSLARSDGNKESDIDILVVVDDLTINLTSELMQTYKIITEKIIAKISPRIHVTTLKYTTFFEYVRTADPVGMNILRDGVALIDTGFFDPMQALLKQGKIRPTYESIWLYYHKAPQTLHNSRWHLYRACEDLYWAVTDAAHAAVMKQGVIPPTPEYLPEMVKQHVLPTKMISSADVTTVKFFYDLYKSITKRKVKDITGAQYEQYYKRANDFVKKIEVYLKK